MNTPVRRLGSMYLLEEKIGQGAMGVVYRGRTEDSPDPLAIKLLLPHLAGDEPTVARFLRERSILSRLDHPNIVRVLDMVIESDDLGIVMEHVEGGDLRRVIVDGSASVSERLLMMADVASGLTAIHEAAVVHRDLKPSNILLQPTESGLVAKVTDFGVARLANDVMTRTSAMIGTPLYMAPEIADERGAGVASDVYSLGAMIYELLVGEVPFSSGPTMAILLAHIQQTPRRLTGVPAEVSDVVSAMLEKSPGNRPQVLEIEQILRRTASLVDDTSEPGTVEAAPNPDDPTVGLPDDAASAREPKPMILTLAEASPAAGSFVAQPTADIADPATVVSGRRLLASGISAGDDVLPPGVNTDVESGGTLAFVDRHRRALSIPALILLAVAGFGAWRLADNEGGAAAAETDQEVVAGAYGEDTPSEGVGFSDGVSGSVTIPEDDVDGEAGAASSASTATQTTSLGEGTTSDSTAASAETTTASNEATTITEPTTMKPTTEGTTTKPTTEGTTTKPTIPATPPSAPVEFVRSPRSTSVGDTSFEFNLVTNDVCSRVQFKIFQGGVQQSGTSRAVSQCSTTYSLSSTAVVAELEEGTDYTVTVTLEGADSDGTTQAGTGTATRSFSVTTTGTSGPVPLPVAYIADPVTVLLVTSTRVEFQSTSNDVCSSQSYTFTNKATGAVDSRHIGAEGCYGPVHSGNSSWNSGSLEPATTYVLRAELRGTSGDGIPGTGSDSTSLEVTTKP